MKMHVVLVLLRTFALVLVTLPKSVGISLLFKFLQLSFSYKLFYLLLQVSAVLCIMSVTFVETAIFPLIVHIG